MRDKTGVSIGKSIVFIALVLCAAALRMAEADGASSLWTDEFATYWIASASTLAECFQRASLTQGQYPLYFLLEWCVLRLFSASEFSLRLLSLTASSVSAGVVYLIASKLMESGMFADSPVVAVSPESPASSSCAKNTEETVASFQAVGEELGRGGEAKNETPSISGARSSILKKRMAGIRSFLRLEAPAILAGALFAVNVNEIYYGQEARPYALATMIALICVLSFLRVVEGNAKTADLAANVFFGALTCYVHYVFGVALILQNLWVALNFKRFDRRFVKRWVAAQAVVVVLCVPLAAHILPILRDTGRWTWLKTAGFADGLAIFAVLLDWKFVLAFAFFWTWALTCEEFISRGCFSGSPGIFHSRRVRFAALWLFLPPVSAYLATTLLKSSLLDARYMLFALPGLFVLMGCCADLARCPGRRVMLPVFTVCLYLMMTAMPCRRSQGRFSYRVSHDWRAALAVLSRQVEPGDAVLLRSGFVKENWVPGSRKRMVLEYAQAPLRSFYFHSQFFDAIAAPSGLAEPSARPTNPDYSSRRLPVFTLPYSYEKRFSPYLESVLAKLADARRVWIIGVNPPNTNYPIENAPKLFASRRLIFRKSFDGVFLCLLASKLQER